MRQKKIANGCVRNVHFQMVSECFRDFGLLCFDRDIITGLIGFVYKEKITCPRAQCESSTVKSKHMYTLDVDLQRVSEQLFEEDGALSFATMDRVLSIWFSLSDAGDGDHKCNECETTGSSNFERIAPQPSELQRYLIVQARDHVFDADEYRDRLAKGQDYFGKKSNAV